jgi:TonB family protein
VQRRWRGAREAYEQAHAEGRLDGRALESVVNVRVRSDGSLAHAQIVQRSGIEPIDTEAVAVFGRAEPFAAPPGEALDDSGGVQFNFRLAVDDSGPSFLQRARRAVRARWRPSPAFFRSGDRERVTVARVLLTAQGVLTSASVVASAGIDFLDRGALEALQAGTQLPGPPDDFVPRAGLVPVLIEFHHTVKRPPPDVRVLPAQGHAPISQDR